MRGCPPGRYATYAPLPIRAKEALYQGVLAGHIGGSGSSAEETVEVEGPSGQNLLLAKTGPAPDSYSGALDDRRLTLMEMYSLEAPASFRLAYVTRPRGGDWLASELARLPVDHEVLLVSALQPHEARELGLELEAAAAAAAGLGFLSLPIPDRQVPESIRAFQEALAPTIGAARHGTQILVHCRQSIGRASLILGALMVELALWDEDGWRRLETARGRPVPDTDEQRQWLRSYAEVARLLSSNRE